MEAQRVDNGSDSTKHLNGVPYSSESEGSMRSKHRQCGTYIPTNTYDYGELRSQASLIQLSGGRQGRQPYKTYTNPPCLRVHEDGGVAARACEHPRTREYRSTGLSTLPLREQCAQVEAVRRAE